MTEPSDKVIELTDVAQQNPLRHVDRPLPPGEPVEQIKAILDRPDAEAFLAALDAQVFYELMRKAGWDQSYDLIQYATPRQIQNFVDFDCWTRDRLIPDKMQKWLAALVTEASDQKLKEVARDLDPETLAIFFKENLVVEEADEGRIPDHLDGDVALSPDGVYAIVFPEDEATTALLRALIDRLYAVDRVLAWTLLEAVRWELMSEMEEHAYRWRTSRLEEFGFVPREEAVEVYSYLNPARYRERIEREGAAEIVDSVVPDQFNLPEVLEDELDDEFYFFGILGRIDDPELVQRTIYQLTALTNRAMVADGIEPGEVESGRQVVRRTLGYLSLGLEFLSRSQPELAERHLVDLPVKRIFQVGYSLTRKLQANIESLVHRPTLSLIEGDHFSLLNADERALAESLMRPRPTFAADRQTYEIFKAQSQLDQAAFTLGLLAFKQLWLFAVVRTTPAEIGQTVYGPESVNDPSTVSFDSLFATWLAHRMLDQEPSFAPVSADELDRLAAVVRDAPWEDDLVGYVEPLLGPVLEALPPQTNRLMMRWVRQTIERLTDELAGVTAVEFAAIFEEVLLVRE